MSNDRRAIEATNEKTTTVATEPIFAKTSADEVRAWVYELSIRDAREAIPGARSKENVKRQVDINEHTVLINLNDIPRIDSWGIALFIQAMQHINAYGGKLALFGIGESVRELLETVRLDQVFPIFLTREEALAHQNGRGQRGCGGVQSQPLQTCALKQQD